MNASKVMIRLAVFMSVVVFAGMQAKVVKTKKLQVMFNSSGVGPVDLRSFFGLNQGQGGITNDPATPRPQGAYDMYNGWIYPAGTIDKNAPSYLFDKHGNPLTEAGSLGVFWCFASELITYTFTDLALLPVGTQIANCNSSFLFKKGCEGTTNNIYAPLTDTTAVNSLGQTLFTRVGVISGGTGCNDDHHNHEYNSMQGDIYADSSGLVFLLEWTFDQEIEYKTN